MGCNLNNKGGVEDEIKTLDLTYITWACDCANWATDQDMKNYTGDSLAERSIFIEAANQAVELPDSLSYSNDRIQFTGQFYKKKGYPKDYSSFQYPDKARVFRYTNFKVLVSNYKNRSALPESFRHE